MKRFSLLFILVFAVAAFGQEGMEAPVEEMATDYEGKAVIGKVNVDNNPEISAKYGVRNIPTILFIKNGEVVDKQVGAVAKDVLAGKLDAQL